MPYASWIWRGVLTNTIKMEGVSKTMEYANSMFEKSREYLKKAAKAKAYGNREEHDINLVLSQMCINSVKSLIK